MTVLGLDLQLGLNGRSMTVSAVQSGGLTIDLWQIDSFMVGLSSTSRSTPGSTVLQWGLDSLQFLLDSMTVSWAQQ